MAEPLVWVTGSGGFLAEVVARHVQATWPAARVIGVGRRALAGERRVEALALDLNDAAALHAALDRLTPDIVFHTAGRVVGTEWPILYRDNVAATLALLDGLVVQAPQARVVVAGSAAECGMIGEAMLPVREEHALHPVSPYGVSKAWQTLGARSYAFRGLHVVVGRIFNIVGRGTPPSTSLGTFAAQLRDIAAGRREPVMHVGNLDTRRDFLDVEDVASALCALAATSSAGELYNICSGRSVGIGEALELLIRLSGCAVRVEIEAARLRPGDVPEAYGSPAKIAECCGWTPRVALSESLSAMLSD